MFCLSCAIAATLLQGAPDYAFALVRKMHPIETWTDHLGGMFISLPRSPNGKLYRVFEFKKPVTFEQVQAIRDGNPGTFFASYRGQVSPGPQRPGITGSLVALQRRRR